MQAVAVGSPHDQHDPARGLARVKRIAPSPNDHGSQPRCRPSCEGRRSSPRAVGRRHLKPLAVAEVYGARVGSDNIAGTRVVPERAGSSRTALDTGSKGATS